MIFLLVTLFALRYKNLTILAEKSRCQLSEYSIFSVSLLPFENVLSRRDKVSEESCFKSGFLCSC